VPMMHQITPLARKPGPGEKVGVAASRNSMSEHGLAKRSGNFKCTPTLAKKQNLAPTASAAAGESQGNGINEF
jgi:hypothetical protein